jgi:Lon protease-like protein
MPAAAYLHTTDLPQLLPVFPLDGAILMPRGRLPLNIFEPRYLNMIDDAMASERIIGMVQTQAGGDRAKPRLARVGCAGRITSFSETADGRYLITLGGVCRFSAGEELPGAAPYRQVRADYAVFSADLDEPEDDAIDRDPMLAALRAYLESRGMEIEWEGVREASPDALVTSLSMALPFEPAEKQALIEAVTLQDRAETLTALLRIDAAGSFGVDDDDAARPLQ